MLQAVRAVVFQTQLAQDCNTTTPGPGCACIPEKDAVEGACAAGYICKRLWDTQQRHAQPSQNDTAKCWPCAFGQYCPAGSYLPNESHALLQAVEQYICRWHNTGLTLLVIQ